MPSQQLTITQVQVKQRVIRHHVAQGLPALALHRLIVLLAQIQIVLDDACGHPVAHLELQQRGRVQEPVRLQELLRTDCTLVIQAQLAGQILVDIKVGMLEVLVQTGAECVLGLG